MYKGPMKHADEYDCNLKEKLTVIGMEKEMENDKSHIKYQNIFYGNNKDTGHTKEMESDKGHIKHKKEKYFHQEGNIKDTGQEKEMENDKGHMQYLKENYGNQKGIIEDTGKSIDLIRNPNTSIKRENDLENKENQHCISLDEQEISAGSSDIQEVEFINMAEDHDFLPDFLTPILTMLILNIFLPTMDFKRDVKVLTNMY